MIKEIKITNFYSFKDTLASLHTDTNVLIGINGAGKSNFLKAIKLLKEGVAGVGLKKHILENLGGFDNIFFKGNIADNSTKNTSIIIEYTFDSKKITNKNYGFRFTDDVIYQITITKSPSLSNFYIQEKITSNKGLIYLDFSNGKGVINVKTEIEVSNPNLIVFENLDSQELILRGISDISPFPALINIKKVIKDIVVYDYFDTTPKSPIRKPVLPTSEKRLFSDGTNLPQILNTIKINHKTEYRKIIEKLNDVNANFTGFDFNMIGGNIELMLEEKGLESAIHVSNISDGTLRYLCLLAILYNPERGNFICIDEPEVGLHPDMLLNIANAIKDASENTTMIISTHSENLLNYFEIENLRVFEKDEDNATDIISYKKEQFSAWYEVFFLGKMWRDGDFGGLRYGS